MWKLVLIASMLPLVAAILLRQWCCIRVLRKISSGVTNQTGHLLAEHLLRHQKLGGEVEVRQKKKTRLVFGNPLRLHLSLKAWNGKGVLNLGMVSNLVGRGLMVREHKELIAWREWAVKFGWAFPVFTLLVVVFAVAVAKVAVMMGIVIVVGALGFASVMLLVTMVVELESAKQVAFLIEDTHALPRQADGEEVARCCRALAWQRVVPGGIEWVLPDPLKGARNSLEAEGE